MSSFIVPDSYESIVSSEIYTIPVVVGTPIPFDEHAVSVNLPLWSDVVGYEEGKKEILSAMKLGYPRFKIHQYIDELQSKYIIDYIHMDNKYSNNSSCMILPTKATALRLKDYLMESITPESDFNIINIIHVIDFYDIHVVYYPTTMQSIAKSYWQHCGEIISSRVAYDLLKHLNIAIPYVSPCFDRNVSILSDSYNILYPTCNTYESLEIEKIIKTRIGDIINEDATIPGTITLTVSGMSAIYTALRIAQKTQQELYNLTPSSIDIVVFGFPYLDTLKIMKRKELNKSFCHFFGHGNNDDLLKLEELLKCRNSMMNSSYSKIGAIFTEFPTNPLLKISDLIKLTELANKYNVILVVDDTIGNFANTDLLHGEHVCIDIICSSLTKIFSGRGDVLAGSLIINKKSKYSLIMKNIVTNQLNIPSLYYKDCYALEYNSRDFIIRSSKINITTKKLLKYFNENEYIQQVYYPIDCNNNDKSLELMYSNLLRNCNNMSKFMIENEYQPGYGCLISIIFKDVIDIMKFYDALDLHKGPSLGTNFTLVCPYTLLAHYTELPWAKNYGVSDKLIRISVGLEDIDYLISKFNHAIELSKI
jgi:cystathionine gamma-synthase